MSVDYCALARKSLHHWLVHQTRLKRPAPIGLRAGCFVSLHDATGALRGCIGTIEPVRDDLADEIIENAVSAGSRDPRFPPLQLPELAQLQIEVSVLAPPEAITDSRQLDPKRYGLILEAGARRGLLLPDLAGVDTVAYQMEIVRQKARIGPEEPVRMYRFVVEKYHEQQP